MRYLYINLVVLGGGQMFQWLDIANIYMLAVMMLEILFIVWLLQPFSQDQFSLLSCAKFPVDKL